MSGGSYNYLRPDNFHEQTYDLERMACRLEGLSWGGAAGAATRDLLRRFAELQADAEQLGSVWHAIEWWDSCDWSEQDAREDVEAWRPPETVTHIGPDPAQQYRLIDIGNGRYELRPVD